jgi:hypothetical protein
MPKPPNDRLSDEAPPADDPQPKVYLVVNGETFVRPALETYYARAPEKELRAEGLACSCNPVTGTFCSCNKVCTCNLVCTCEGHATCGCVGYRAPSSGGGTYCSCNQVCTCVPVH